MPQARRPTGANARRPAPACGMPDDDVDDVDDDIIDMMMMMLMMRMRQTRAMMMMIMKCVFSFLSDLCEFPKGTVPAVAERHCPNSAETSCAMQRATAITWPL